MTKRASPEATLQRSAVQYLDALERTGKIRYMANYVNIPRGDEWAAKQGANNKRLGVRPGFPDLTIYIPGYGPMPHGNCQTVYIELKSKTGTLSKKQKDWRDWLQTAGFECFLCRSLDEVKKVIEEVL
jgi:hypothetical protein